MGADTIAAIAGPETASAVGVMKPAKNAVAMAILTLTNILIGTMTNDPPRMDMQRLRREIRPPQPGPRGMAGWQLRCVRAR